MARKKKEKEEPKQDYEILIGFVHGFTYNTDRDVKSMNGHPEEGRVYRIIKDEYGYRLHLGRETNNRGMDGLYLGEDLVGEQPKYSFNIEVVTPKNYLNFSLYEEDREKLFKWLETDNADLWEALKREQSGEVPVIRNVSDLMSVIRDTAERAKAEEASAASILAKERALEATLTLMTHFKNKKSEELVSLFDAMYGRILTIIAK